MAKNLITSSAKIAANLAGTMIGAGFASGQELSQFFVAYGSMGLTGLLVTCLLFTWLGIQILSISYRLHAASYHEILYYVCGKRLGFLLDGLIAMFLFGVLTITLAGANTLVLGTLHLPYAGLFFMGGSLLLTTLYGLTGITAANLVITPLVTAALLMVSLSSLVHHEVSLAVIHFPAQTNLPIPHWLLASLLYLSYNLIMSTTVLAPLGAQISQHSHRVVGSMVGGILLMLLAGLITLVVILHYPQALEYEIPMLFIVSSQHLIHQTSYIFVFSAALYTTGLACLYGCATKLTTITGFPIKNSLLLLLTLSLFFSTVGFADLIGKIFPIFGYATLWFTGRLLYLSFFPK